MRRRWFGIVLMLWASVGSLIAFAPAALANGEQYTFVGTNIQGSGGNLDGTVTFTCGGGTCTYLDLVGGASKVGPTEYIYTISDLKKNAASVGGYSAKITCVRGGGGVGGACPSLTSPIANIAAPAGSGPAGTGPNTGSNPAPPAAATGTGPATPAAAADTCTGGGALGWVLCPIVNLMVEMVGWIETNFLQPFLAEPPFTQTGALAPVYLIWQAFRNIASVFFILVFFLVIFGTAIGFDNYTIKKVLPHLIAGAILVPFSWYICAIGIDIGNVLGQGMNVIMNHIVPAPKIDFGTNLESLFYAGGAVLLASLALIGMSMGILFTVLIAATATYFTLILRKLLIIVLVIISPFAILAWILPNTQKIFKMWYSNLLRLILMYPLIMLLFEAGRLFASVAGAAADVGGPGQNAITPLIQLTGLFLPLAMVPWTFSMAGSAMKFGTNGIGKVSGAANKKWGRGSESDKQRHERFKDNRAFDARTGNAFMRGIARKQSGTGGFVFNGTGIPIGKKDEEGNRKMLFAQGKQAKSDMIDKAEKHKALDAKVSGYDEAAKTSKINKERELNAGTNASAHSFIEARKKEATNSDITITGFEVAPGVFEELKSKVGAVPLTDVSIPQVKQAARDAIAANDYGGAAAHMESLARTVKGRTALDSIQEELGHNEQVVVAQQYQELWDSASETVDARKNPGLKKNKKSAYTGNNPADIMAMDPQEKGRNYQWGVATGNAQNLSEGGNSVSIALGSDRTRERLSNDDIRAMYDLTQTTRGLEALLKANNETALGATGTKTYDQIQYLSNRLT